MSKETSFKDYADAGEQIIKDYAAPIGLSMANVALAKTKEDKQQKFRFLAKQLTTLVRTLPSLLKEEDDLDKKLRAKGLAAWDEVAEDEESELILHDEDDDLLLDYNYHHDPATGRFIPTDDQGRPVIDSVYSTKFAGHGKTGRKTRALGKRGRDTARTLSNPEQDNCGRRVQNPAIKADYRCRDGEPLKKDRKGREIPDRKRKVTREDLERIIREEIIKSLNSGI